MPFLVYGILKIEATVAYIEEVKLLDPLPERPNILVCAAGTPNAGGTGGAHIVACMQHEIIKATPVGLMSEYEDGGVREKAEKLRVPFFHYPSLLIHEAAIQSGAHFVIFCGWKRDAVKLDPRRTIALERSVKGNGTYLDAPREGAIAYLNGSPEADIVIRFVTGPTVSDGPEIIRIPVDIQVGSDFQLPRADGKRVPLFPGTPQERLERITRYWL